MCWREGSPGAEETGLTGTEVPQGYAHSGGREGDSFSRISWLTAPSSIPFLID